MVNALNDPRCIIEIQRESPCTGAPSDYLSPNNGEPAGLRGLPDANDPMNLIRVMPAEEL